MSPSGVVSIAGGKLTTYREMAEDTVDAVLERLGRTAKCRTRRLPLVGADGFTTPRHESAETHLAGRYGSLAGEIRGTRVAERPELGEPLVPGLPYLQGRGRLRRAERDGDTLDDVLSRRLRARLLDRDATVAAAADDVARLIAPELGWDEAEITGRRRVSSACAYAAVALRAEDGCTPSDPTRRSPNR